MLRTLRLSLVLLLIGLGPAGEAAARERVVPHGRDQMLLSFAPLVRSTAPAVVSIYTRRTVRQRSVAPLFDDPFFQRFVGDLPGPPRPRMRVENALGSGVIVRSQGLVVTNHHVIEGADEITVRLSDRREFIAEAVLSDERTDLAVLQLQDIEDDTDLPSLTLADSDELEVGDLVLAIGNPFGVGQTVTSGIVSALARTAVGIADYSFFIQTDAAINPGNSGGALIDLDGNLVGINTAIFSRTGGSLGIGFAVPANMVGSVVAGVEAGMPLVRPWIGADGQEVTADIARSLGLDQPGGVLINDIRRRGPAEEAGLRVGDVITAVNDRPVGDTGALRYRIATQPIGGEATLQVLREGRMLDVTIALVPPPEVPPRQTTLLQGRNPLAGAVVANLSPALIEEMALESAVREGVVVLEVQPRTPAQRLRLEPGDVLVRVNDVSIDSVDTVVSVLDRGWHREWRLAIRRGDRVIETVVYG